MSSTTHLHRFPHHSRVCSPIMPPPVFENYTFSLNSAFYPSQLAHNNQGSTNAFQLEDQNENWSRTSRQRPRRSKSLYSQPWESPPISLDVLMPSSPAFTSSSSNQQPSPRTPWTPEGYPDVEIGGRVQQSGWGFSLGWGPYQNGIATFEYWLYYDFLRIY